MHDEQADALFDRFVEPAEARLRRALVATLGQHDGMEATAIALAYACPGDRRRLIPNTVCVAESVGRVSRIATQTG